jgi:hypothetical protein
MLSYFYAMYLGKRFSSSYNNITVAATAAIAEEAILFPSR